MSLKSNILKIDPKFWHVEYHLSGGGFDMLRYGININANDIGHYFDFDISEGFLSIGFGYSDDFEDSFEFEIKNGPNNVPEDVSFFNIILVDSNLSDLKPMDVYDINPQILVDVDPVVMNRLLLNKEDFECIAQVAKHCDWEQLCLYIREQQNLTLLPLVGDCIFNLLMQDEGEWDDEIKNLWHGSTFEGCGGENKTHFGLKMSLIHWAYGAYVYRHSAVDTPFGVVQKVGRESVPVEISQLRAINKEQRENADFYFERTKEYLCKIKSDVGCGGCDCICNYCSNSGRKVQNRGFKFRLVSKKI